MIPSSPLLPPPKPGRKPPTAPLYPAPRPLAKPGDRRLRRVRIIDGVPHYRCNKCGKWKPADTDNFYREPRDHSRCGLHSYCKPCEKSWKGKHRSSGMGRPRIVLPVAEIAAAFVAGKTFMELHREFHHGRPLLLRAILGEIGVAKYLEVCQAHNDAGHEKLRGAPKKLHVSRAVFPEAAIAERYKRPGETLQSVAAAFNTSHTTVWKICRRVLNGEYAGVAFEKSRPFHGANDEKRMTLAEPLRGRHEARYLPTPDDIRRGADAAFASRLASLASGRGQPAKGGETR